MAYQVGEVLVAYRSIVNPTLVLIKYSTSAIIGGIECGVNQLEILFPSDIFFILTFYNMKNFCRSGA